MKKEQLLKEIDKFYGFVKTKLNIKQDPEYKLVDDVENSQNLFGKTGGYDPNTSQINLYYLGRHPKDVLRSFGHECVHHMQNERGDLKPKDVKSLHNVGYALEDGHLRKMEEEAYEKGSMLLRDYEDMIKTGKNPLGDKNMDEKLINKIAEGILAKIKSMNLSEKEEVKLDKEKADLDKDGKLSGYEKKRGAAIQKAMKNKKTDEIKKSAKAHAKQDTSQRSTGDKKELEDKEKEEVKGGRMHEEEMKKRDEYIYELLLQKFNIK